MANPPVQYRFRRVIPADLKLIAAWRAFPHVAKWWDGDEPGSTTDLADPRVARWIVSLDNRPFAYMQDYDPQGWPDHHFGHLPNGSRGIDQLIGPPGMIGKGHGPAFIAQRVATLFSAGAPAVATDPDPGNTRAIAAYEKAGFRATGPAQDTRWGRILPMVITAP